MNSHFTLITDFLIKHKFNCFKWYDNARIGGPYNDNVQNYLMFHSQLIIYGN